VLRSAVLAATAVRIILTEPDDPTDPRA
jgi:hypothetical protein